MIQLPADFSPAELPVLKRFLEQLPLEFEYAVEVRHRGFFDLSADALRLSDLLYAFEVHRVTFDSRALHAFAASDEMEQESQQRKPRLPVNKVAHSRSPILRLIGRNELSRAQPWIDEWAPVIAEWILEGRRPYVFTHAPNDLFAPEMARRFHDALRRHLGERWEPLPPFPGESVAKQKELW